jgi:hypothetical protein
MDICTILSGSGTWTVISEVNILKDISLLVDVGMFVDLLRILHH